MEETIINLNFTRMETFILTACIDNICKELNWTRNQIKSVQIGGTMFIVENKSGAIATIDYSFK